jgi:hypothetical protein
MLRPVCFSATASFAASAALTGAGALALARARRRALWPFAAMPLLFAGQQLAEGLLWRAHARATEWRVFSPLVQAFLFFALLVWPAYLPLASAAMERDPRRRRVLAALVAPGLALGVFLFARASMPPVHSCIAAQHLFYALEFPGPTQPWIYAAYLCLAVAPLVVSSVRGTTLFAGGLVGSFALAASFNRVTLISVWCFFAAILSVSIVAIVAGDAARGGQQAAKPGRAAATPAERKAA